MTGPDGNPWHAPQPGGAPPPQQPPVYGQQPAPYGQQPGWQPGAYAAPYGPVGQVRATGRCVLLLLVTAGVYSYVYNYKVHKEMKEHTGRGVGGGVALLLTFLASIAMPFVTSAEVGGLYSRRGLPEPVRGWTGLWLLLPVVGGYVMMIVLAIALGASAPDSTAGDALPPGFAVGLLVFLAMVVAGALVWFVKTNGALNRYWESVAT